jgi:hypothetical protein
MPVPSAQFAVCFTPLSRPLTITPHMQTCHATLRTSRSAIVAPTLISQIALPDLYASYGRGFRRRSCGRYSFSRFSPCCPVKGPFQTTPPPLVGSSEVVYMHMDIRNMPVSVFGQLIECHVRPDSLPHTPHGRSIHTCTHSNRGRFEESKLRG